MNRSRVAFVLVVAAFGIAVLLLLAVARSAARAANGPAEVLDPGQSQAPEGIGGPAVLAASRVHRTYPASLLDTPYSCLNFGGS